VTEVTGGGTVPITTVETEDPGERTRVKTRTPPTTIRTTMMTDKTIDDIPCLRGFIRSQGSRVFDMTSELSNRSVHINLLQKVA
jgi:hypothetical protein